MFGLPPHAPRPLRSSSRARRLIRLLGAGALVSVGLLGAAGDAQAEKIHVVAEGQLLFRIARRYNVTVEAIQEANNLDERSKLKPGMKLVIPEKGREAEAKKQADKIRDGGKKGVANPGRSKDGKGDKDGRDGKGAKDGKKRDDQKKVDYARTPKKRGLVEFKRDGETFKAQVTSGSGKVRKAALTELGKILQHRSGAKHDISPELATLIVRVSDHFGGRPLHVVSGYRPKTPTQYTPHSNHNSGKAVDFRVEGVPNEALRDFCKTLAKAGCGYYPNSSFVHLDTRPTKFHWVDYSGPGEAPRYAHLGGASKIPASVEPSEPAEPKEAASLSAKTREAGSPDTQVTPQQPVENTAGNGGTADESPRVPRVLGSRRPTHASRSR